MPLSGQHSRTSCAELGCPRITLADAEAQLATLRALADAIEQERRIVLRAQTEAEGTTKMVAVQEKLA